MLVRGIETRLRERLSASPAAALIGPRQCGKTTLARSFGGEYFDLELEAERVRLDAKWEQLVEARKLLVLDEAQTHPAIFPRLRAAIDEDRARDGRFLLLGSIAPTLMKQVTESLAGRLAIVEMGPFSLSEVEAVRGVSLERLWLVGGFPPGGILDRRRFPGWQEDYVRLLTERDLPSWGLPASPRVTQRLIRMLAALHGQIWNASQLGQSLGVSYHTVNSYVDWLEGAFLLRRLEPWSGSLFKRLVKAPRVYWRDSGLLHAQLHVEDEEDLLAKFWVGASFEGFVIEQVRLALETRGIPYVANYFRTHTGNEIDLVLEIGDRRLAIEIKLTTSPSQADAARLLENAELIGATECFLVSRASRVTRGDSLTLCPLPALIDFVCARSAKKKAKRVRRRV